MHTRSKRYRRRAQARQRVASRKKSNHQKCGSASVTQKGAADGSVLSELSDPVIYLVSNENRFASRIASGLLRYRDDHLTTQVTLSADPTMATLSKINSR